MSKPLVSILLNCYNASNYISKAIQSVLDQTYLNWELIVWDDGSTDDTLKKIKKFDSEKIKIFSNKYNVGLGKSRINAIKKLNGDLVAILDSDDYFHKEKLSKQVEIFEKHPNVSLCSSWCRILDEKNNLLKNINYNLSNTEIKNKINFLNVLANSSLMYRRNIAEQFGWYSKKFEYSQDYDLTLKLLEKNDLFLIREYLTFIMLHSQSMTNTKHLNILSVKEQIVILRDNLKKKQFSNEERTLIKTIINVNLVRLYFKTLKDNTYNSLKNLILIFLKNPSLFFKLRILRKIRDR